MDMWIWAGGLAVFAVCLGVCVVIVAQKFGWVRSLRVTAPAGMSIDVQGDVRVEPHAQALLLATEALEVAQRADARSERLELRVTSTERDLAAARVEIERLRAREAELLRQIEVRDGQIADLEEELAAVRARLDELNG